MFVTRIRIAITHVLPQTQSFSNLDAHNSRHCSFQAKYLSWYPAQHVSSTDWTLDVMYGNHVETGRL
jgi:hypothetical protein